MRPYKHPNPNPTTDDMIDILIKDRSRLSWLLYHCKALEICHGVKDTIRERVIKWIDDDMMDKQYPYRKWANEDEQEAEKND